MASESAARVLIVADDLTGALDSAGAFASQGIPTKVVAQTLASDPQAVRDAQVVAVNTASRHLPPDDAAAQVQWAARHFAGQPFDYIYKKVDSTLRGNVVSETVALMDSCGRGVALVAPAFPAQGRTVINGIVHVEGLPLSLTGFATDALSPPPLEPLGEVFGSVIGRDHVKAWRHGEVVTWPDVGVVIADADSEDHMSELFDKVAGQAHQILLVGSAGLGEILASRLHAARNQAARDQAAKSSATPLTATDSPIVYVVGSRAARSREQVEQLRRESDTVVIDAPNGVASEIVDAQGARQVVLLAVDDPEADMAEPAEVAQRLARTGLEIAAFVRAGALVVTGGDTAIAILETASCRVLDVCGNLMPGIPFSSFELKGRPMHLVTKAGGFGTADTFVDILRCFRSGTIGRAEEGA
ncbi:MAG: four-carbon acid sugar kinase family protein [Betaproteobacteria bacterium]|nr:MAG: four-carbon acid sugar kinase family protein [Betaproteobacteria bacterium]